MERMLLATCGNDAPSGGCGYKTAQVNLYSVQYALRFLGLRVLVFGATTRARFQEGWILGRWSIGKCDGKVVGGLVWFTEDGHAQPLLPAAFDALSRAVQEAGANVIPPWELFDVGAPKKKKSGFRGGDPRSIGEKGNAALRQRRRAASLAMEESAECVVADDESEGGSMRHDVDSMVSDSGASQLQQTLPVVQASREGVVRRSARLQGRAVLAADGNEVSVKKEESAPSEAPDGNLVLDLQGVAAGDGIADGTLLENSENAAAVAMDPELAAELADMWRRLASLDAESDAGNAASTQGKRRRYGAIPDDAWRQFTPSVIDEKLCMARVRNLGKGGQCRSRRLAGRDLCFKHSCQRSLKYGRVTEAIPEKELRWLLREAEKKQEGEVRRALRQKAAERVEDVSGFAGRGCAEGACADLSAATTLVHAGFDVALCIETLRRSAW